MGLALGDLQRFQNRQLFLGEGLGLCSQLGQVLFCALQRLAFFDELLVLGGEYLPDVGGPVAGLFFALAEGLQEELLEAVDADAAAGDRAGQGFDIVGKLCTGAQVLVKGGAALLYLFGDCFGVTRGDGVHAD